MEIAKDFYVEGFSGPPPTSPAMMQTKSPRTLRSRIFRLTVLISLALALCTLVPLPRGALRNERSQLLSYPGSQAVTVDPAEEWKDNIWPFRPQAPWDISTDLPHPRVLEYDVDEGTWLRLDVNGSFGPQYHLERFVY